MTTPVLIVGGGPAGMASAIALTQAGVPCEIVEISEDWRPGGIGIALQSAPLRATKQLGIFDELLRVGRPHMFIDMCAADGTRFAELPQVNVNEPQDPPFLGMARESLHDVMAAEVRRLGVTVHLGVTVARISEPDVDGVDVELSNGRTDRFRYVIGADGVNSATRKNLLPNAPSPQYAGQMIWRAAAITPPQLERYTMLIGGPVRLGLVPLPDGRLYLWMLDSTLGPDRPPRDRMVELFQERISRFGGPAPAVAAQLSDEAQLDLRALQWLLLPPPWSAGRTLLIGDAVHTTTPHLAFGAGLALEDAVVLGELAGAGLEFPELAAGFAARRYERARLVVESSLQLSKWEQEPGPPNPGAGRLIGQTMAALSAPI
ncbi:MAG TPA: FAD-dependent monooxygenase [Pseudolysinimonas sp.]|nr:FAD-dependent monooxygenase [Pseudolysinimonas sp.]